MNATQRCLNNKRIIFDAEVNEDFEIKQRIHILRIGYNLRSVRLYVDLNAWLGQRFFLIASRISSVLNGLTIYPDAPNLDASAAVSTDR